LKICGQKIAGFHVTKLMKEDNQCWFIQAGRESVSKLKLEKFRKGGYAAVDYYEICNFDLSGMTKEEIEVKTTFSKFLKF
jgi:hypothetical protein